MSLSRELARAFLHLASRLAFNMARLIGILNIMADELKEINGTLVKLVSDMPRNEQC